MGLFDKFRKRVIEVVEEADSDALSAKEDTAEALEAINQLQEHEAARSQLDNQPTQVEQEISPSENNEEDFWDEEVEQDEESEEQTSSSDNENQFDDDDWEEFEDDEVIIPQQLSRKERKRQQREKKSQIKQI